jgi:hypothetical protein
VLTAIEVRITLAPGRLSQETAGTFFGAVAHYLAAPAPTLAVSAVSGKRHSASGRTATRRCACNAHIFARHKNFLRKAHGRVRLDDLGRDPAIGPHRRDSPSRRRGTERILGLLYDAIRRANTAHLGFGGRAGRARTHRWRRLRPRRAQRRSHHVHARNCRRRCGPYHWPTRSGSDRARTNSGIGWASRRSKKLAGESIPSTERYKPMDLKNPRVCACASSMAHALCVEDNNGLGPVDIHRNQSAMAATVSIAVKLVAVFS